MLYRRDIDGMRALAVSSVILYHGFPHFIPGGYIGVDFFFVISGYLITSIIVREYEQGNFSIYRFYERRILRIFPALVIVILFALCIGWFVLFADEFLALGRIAAAATVFAANFILYSESGYFDTIAEYKPLLHLWSLGIEEQFYLIWPFIVVAGIRLKRPDLFFFVLLVGSFTACVLITLANRDFAFFMPFTRFWELIAGGMLGLHSGGNRSTFRTGGDKFVARHHDWLSTVGLLLFLLAVFNLKDTRNFPGFAASLPVVAALVMIWAGPVALINRLLLSRSPLVGIGLISYPLYLWHWPILSYLRIVSSGHPPIWAILTAILLSVILSVLTYLAVERRFRNGRDVALKVRALLASMCIVFLAGVAVVYGNGLDERGWILSSQANRRELQRSPMHDDDCGRIIGALANGLRYCRYDDAGSSRTVLLIGDSHAHVAFSGLAMEARARGYNSLLLGTEGNPPFYLGDGVNHQKSNAQLEKIMDYIIKNASHLGIKTALIVVRGPYYLTGWEPSRPSTSAVSLISELEYSNSIQRIVDELSKKSIETIIITENPEMPFFPEDCITRPVRLFAIECSISRKEVLMRQEPYRALLSGIRGARVVDTIDVFCREACSVFDEVGGLLYADDDHISRLGSIRQARSLARQIFDGGGN